MRCQAFGETAESIPVALSRRGSRAGNAGERAAEHHVGDEHERADHRERDEVRSAIA
jgi:hypothetical protein